MKCLPIITLISMYMHWIKPRLLCSSGSVSSRSLMLHLGGHSRILIPMIVFSAFWLFDTRMEIEYTFSMMFRRREIPITHNLADNVALVNIDRERNHDDIFNLSFDDSSESDLNMMEILDMQMVLQELINEH